VLLADRERSRERNRQTARKRLRQLVERALTPPKAAQEIPPEPGLRQAPERSQGAPQRGQGDPQKAGRGGLGRTPLDRAACQVFAQRVCARIVAAVSQKPASPLTASLVERIGGEDPAIPAFGSPPRSPASSLRSATTRPTWLCQGRTRTASSLYVGSWRHRLGPDRRWSVRDCPVILSDVRQIDQRAPIIGLDHQRAVIGRLGPGKIALQRQSASPSARQARAWPGSASVAWRASASARRSAPAGLPRMIQPAGVEASVRVVALRERAIGAGKAQRPLGRPRWTDPPAPLHRRDGSPDRLIQPQRSLVIGAGVLGIEGVGALQHGLARPYRSQDRSHRSTPVAQHNSDDRDKQHARLTPSTPAADVRVWRMAS
jgi:hypothetical protein